MALRALPPTLLQLNERPSAAAEFSRSRALPRPRAARSLRGLIPAETSLPSHDTHRQQQSISTCQPFAELRGSKQYFSRGAEGQAHSTGFVSSNQPLASGEPLTESSSGRIQPVPVGSGAAPERGVLSRRQALVSGAISSILAGELVSVQSALSVQESDVAVIRRAVREALTPAKCPGMLRLAFHDAGTYDLATGTGGINGSIIFELDRPENKGLKRYVKLLDKVRDDLSKKSISVSWADLIAVGGAEAVELCGGPHIDLRLGRRDLGKADEKGRMPSETFDATQVIESFKGKGYSLQETVVLLGAHTLGGKGFGDATQFDNSYFSILLLRPWLDKSIAMAEMIGLPSDKAIVESQDAKKWIEVYAADEQRFFKDFQGAYVKMVDSGATWEA